MSIFQVLTFMRYKRFVSLLPLWLFLLFANNFLGWHYQEFNSLYAQEQKLSKSKPSKTEKQSSISKRRSVGLAKYSELLLLTLHEKFMQSENILNRLPATKKQMLKFRLISAYNQIQMGKLISARLTIKDTLKMYPKIAAVHALHCYWARKSGRLDYAIAYGHRGLDANTNNPQILFLEIAAAEYLQNDFSKAQIYLRKIFANNQIKSPEYFYAVYLDGLIQLIQKKYPYAIFRFHQALSFTISNPRSLVSVYHNLGVAYYYSAQTSNDNQNLVKAKQYFKTADKIAQDQNISNYKPPNIIFSKTSS